MMSWTNIYVNGFPKPFFKKSVELTKDYQKDQNINKQFNPAFYVRKNDRLISDPNSAEK